MEVFVSWSGDRSKAMAYGLKSFLGNVIQSLQPWLSDEDIPKGDRWAQKISERLKSCQLGIICVTPENLDSPWLNFEAGALSKQVGKARVCPVLLGISPSDDFFRESPLSQFQATTFARQDMYKLVESLNRELRDKKLESYRLEKSFGKYWTDFENEITEGSKKCISSSNLITVIKALEGHGLPQPSIGRVVCFREGFESHLLYQAACSIAKQRLYIFGRKNRKVFDKDNFDFFKYLPQMRSEGFDFKCLFLNPNSPDYVISEAHEDPDFLDQLKVCINHVIKVLSQFNINPDDVCRAYSTHRQTELIVADNSVLFSHVRIGASGKACRLTKCGFEVVDANVSLGETLINNFLKTWETAIPIMKIF